MTTNLTRIGEFARDPDDKPAFTGQRGPGSEGKANDALRFPCSVCGSLATRVTNTRPAKGGGRRRRYTCQVCLTRFSSLELVVESQTGGNVTMVTKQHRTFLKEVSLDDLFSEIARRVGEHPTTGDTP